MNFNSFVEFVSGVFKNSSFEYRNLGFSLKECSGLNYGDGQYFRLEDNQIIIDLVRNEGYADLFDSSWNFWIAVKTQSGLISQKLKDFLMQSDFPNLIDYEITIEFD